MRPRLASVAAIATSAFVASLTASASASASDTCSILAQPIYQRVKPSNDASLVTPWLTEAIGAGQNHGFTTDNGVAFKAVLAMSPGLVPVHRIYHPGTGDFHTVQAGDVAEWEAQGYTDQGQRFFAMPAANGCGLPVHTYAKGNKTRQVVAETEIDDLVGAGWSSQGISYYAGPATVTPPTDPDADGKFAIAVIPDTQTEVFGTITQFTDRTRWLVSNRTALDLRYVAHTGDVTNWGWLMPSQFEMASRAAGVLDAAAVPYAFAIGNHDTRAVGHDGVPGSRGYGGSAYVNNPECEERLGPVECNSLKLVRHTEEFNEVFPLSRYRNVGGTFEAGKVDNIYSTFEAAGARWLVLTLELWPRPEAVEWAQDVVAANPDRNVIVQTHSYLNANGSISQSNGGYGATSPQYLYDNLIKVYPNIKLIFSGHTGSIAKRIDTGVNGNKIISYLGNFDTSSGSPVRLVEIDVRAGAVKNWVYDPTLGRVTSAAQTVAGMSFVG